MLCCQNKEFNDHMFVDYPFTTQVRKEVEVQVAKVPYVFCLNWRSVFKNFLLKANSNSFEHSLYLWLGEFV